MASSARRSSREALPPQWWMASATPSLAAQRRAMDLTKPRV
uniref:Uncharacterized protein n=1 Tax=Arundo donax TaxID=35708 RepID=A0A0A9A1F4_ARUDO